MRGSGVYSETSQRSDADEMSRFATDGQLEDRRGRRQADQSTGDGPEDTPTEKEMS